MLHDNAQGLLLAHRIIDQKGLADSNDTLPFHAPFAGALPLDQLVINIHLEADTVILLEDIQFFPFLGAMKVQTSSCSK
jgi:hypothetical protein